MGASEPLLTCIKTQLVNNVERRVSKGYNIPSSIAKQKVRNSTIPTFCLLQSWSRDQR